jgi:hypothetical protein
MTTQIKTNGYLQQRQEFYWKYFNPDAYSIAWKEFLDNVMIAKDFIG